MKEVKFQCFLETILKVKQENINLLFIAKQIMYVIEYCLITFIVNFTRRKL